MTLLLDLFCGVGGAAKGYADAGFTVIGVDRYLQPNYPYPALVMHDAPATLRRLIQNPNETIVPNHPIGASQKHGHGYALKDFAVIHASPPCQHYSNLADRHRNRYLHPDLLPIVRELLQQTEKPYIIENVEEAPLIKEQTIMLCGMTFHESHGVRVIRHRKFEASSPIKLTAPPHVTRWDHPAVFTFDKRRDQWGKLDETDQSTFVTVTGGGNCTFATARKAMCIPWAKIRSELNDAIPPPYTEYVGNQLIEQLAA